MLSMGVCTTRYWQTSSRLVQELNVCTVDGDHNKSECGEGCLNYHSLSNEVYVAVVISVLLNFSNTHLKDYDYKLETSKLLICPFLE